MTTLTVLAGERTIGGTQIVIEDQGARLLFDCGLAFDPAGNPFAHVRQRPWRALPDLLALGLAPYIPGLYRPDVARMVPDSVPFSIPPGEGPLAVALSHSHLDHTHLVGFVDPAVPIYAADATTRIVPLLGETGSSLGPTTRSLTSVAPNEAITVGPLRVQFVPVDHDVCGACGLLIETSDGVIAYSGDLRLHGAHPMRTLAFAQAARAAGARVLILEGTRLQPPPEPGVTPLGPDERVRVEADVVPETCRVLQEAPHGLGIILLTPENGERVEALAQALTSIGRLLVLDAHGLAFATAALGRPIAASHALYVPAALERSLQENDATVAPSLAAAVAAAPRRVTAAEIAANPAAFLLRLAFESFADLPDLLTRGQGGVLIQANGTPLGRFDPGWVHMEWWARTHGLQVVEHSCSGHAAPSDLALIAAQSGAPTVLAMHSHCPEFMPVARARLVLPERGRPYTLHMLGAS